MQAMLAKWKGVKGYIFYIKKVPRHFSNHFDMTIPLLHIPSIKGGYWLSTLIFAQSVYISTEVTCKLL